MSHATGAAPPSGLDAMSPGKLGMWVFLVTDAISFSGLLISYGVLRAGAHNWPDPSHRLGIAFTAVMTFVLICSSVTMVMALKAAEENRRRPTAAFLAATLLGGLLFLSGQAYEWHHLMVDKGAGLTIDQMWSTFFVITGFHGLHVAVGVIYLGVMLLRTLAGRLDGKPGPVEVAGLFWHFVDLIWILVFTFVYLV
jgi:heme/copper-type cytochrome/quinol oxidase subunit 3